MSDIPDSLDQIAIIGMAGRFPGASDLDAFWDNLAAGKEGIASFTEQELVESGVSPDLLRQDNYVRAKGVLDGADQFDARFFGYSPREAEILDPQHRVFLECAWQAVEAAGCVPREFSGRIGVFAGAALNTYLLYNVLANRRFAESVGMYQTLLGSDKDFLSTRVAYKLGLRGPAITVQTACSTSLTAVHLACQSLLNGECDIALAGGVAVSAPLKHGYLYEPGGIASPDGHCRPFDADAGGTVPGNGVGVVVLRRLADARQHGDAVAAVILGTAINNDGSVKAGYTAPSADGQADVIAEAMAVADVNASTIGYVETHGTGTALGDPIEIAALTRAFRTDTEDTGYCAIGSVKGSIGHLDAASGVAGLIKTVLMLQHRAIPPSLHFRQPNPELRLAASPFFVNDRLRPWPRPGTPRRAGVSSFGIGGTNVHVVLEEVPPAEPVPERDHRSRPVLLPLSAKSAGAVADSAQRLADYLENHPGAGLDDVAHTLARRRQAFGYRHATVATTLQEAAAALRQVDSASVGTAADTSVPIAFLFPGQGAQYLGMAAGLYEREPVFAAALDRCATLFAEHLDVDLRELLFPAPAEADSAAARLAETEITQPAMFSIEYALAQLWASWGVRPSAMAGHSIGEYVAACLAGVFSEEDAARLVAARGRLIQAMPRGAMLTVFLPEAEATEWLTDELSLAAVNSTALSVASGPAEAVGGLEQRLRDAGISCRRLRTSHAFHSPSMDGAVEPFVAEVASVKLHPPRIPFCSDVTGTWITDEQVTSPEYWGRHLRQAVRFADAAATLLSDPSLVFAEVGPGHTLSSFIQAHQAWQDGRTLVGSLRHPNESGDDQARLLQSLGTLWSAGVTVDWDAVNPGSGRVLPLPGYPFQRERYWVAPDASPAPRPTADTPAAAIDDWFYTVGWKRLPVLDGVAEPVPDVADTQWVILGGQIGLGRALIRQFTVDGATVCGVSAGEGFTDLGERTWSLDPGNREHFASLVRTLDAQEPRRMHFVHLLSLADGPDGPLDEAGLERARQLGFDSLLALAQGIGDARPSAAISIDVLCQGIHDVTGTEALQPQNATLTGIATVIPQELPDVGCRILDITGIGLEHSVADAVRTVRDLVIRRTSQRELALRGRHWWHRDFDRVRLTAGPDGATLVRDHGVYLITGGLGGLGLAFAERIAEHAGNPLLALLSRAGLPAEREWTQWLACHDEQDPNSTRIRRILRLRERGARVVICQGDVTDLGQTAAHVARLRAEFGAVNGIVHAAGMPSTGMIARKTKADADQVLAAKTRGTLVLDRVSAADDLDFFLLCSSVTALLGGPGQSDYCAANAFLDAFAQWRRQSGAPVTSVNWGTWDGVGMAAGLTHPVGEPTQHPLLRRIAATGSSRTYATVIRTADHWIVGDHRLMGHGLVPGTAYLDLVYAALAEQADGRDIELRDVLFIVPVIVPDGHSRTVYTTIEERDGRLRFAVRSQAGDGAWREHATGWALLSDRTPDTIRDLEAVRSGCEVREVLQTEEEILGRARMDRYATGQLTFRYGPRWQVVRRIELGRRRMLATLQLADEFLADLDSYPLHPAMLDMAVGIFRLDEEYPYYLPLGYRSLRVHHPLTGTVYCAATLAEPSDTPRETLTCDVELLDANGRVLVQIDGYSVKRVNDIPAMMTQIEHAVAEAAAGTDPADDGARAAGAAALIRGMSEQEGKAAFDRILAAVSLPGQLIVSARDPVTLRELAQSITPELASQGLAGLAPPVSAHPRPELDTPYLAPATPEEQFVTAIWQEVLGVDQVGVNDDFFALGGHSLAAVQISTKIRGRTGVDLDLRDFFSAPTVACLATLLAAGQQRDTGPDGVIEAVSRTQPDDGLDELDELSDEEVDARLRELLAADADGPDSQA